MADITRVTVPTKSYQEMPLKARKTASLARGPFILTNSSPEAQKGLKLFEEAIEIQGYIQGTPESSKYKKLKDTITSIHYEGITIEKIGMLIVSSALFAKSYISHYEAITGESGAVIPYLDLALPAYGIYSSMGSIMTSYQGFINAETTDDSYNAFFDLVGVGSNILYNVLKVFAYLALAEISEPVALGLYTLMYLSSLADVVKAEYSSYPTAEERYKTPPQIIYV